MSEDSKNKTYELPESFKRNHQFMPITDHPISLRDQFAMAALPIAWKAKEDGYYEGGDDDVAECAYQMADAMLKARNKQS
ncbi:hypothetical protein AB6G46_10865 [Providencia hangzhouensis]|uniref:hypothetical protein n=1 Tax=Providencia hangzhouensis TaxID=3031799 RepID=UPI0034DDBD5E